jgi:glycosyltransferase involved in cell wall biosynthesis
MLVSDWPAVVGGNLREFFRSPSGPVFKSFEDWHGADVALATGWETVHPVLRLDHCRARAYLVQDHEPEFFGTSAQRLWAEQTYDEDLFAIAASPWLAELVHGRSGRPATHFILGVDHAVYRPQSVQRDENTVIFYARDVTARRGVPLGLLALAELHRRRPSTRFVLFGDLAPARTPFAYEHLGIVSPEQLARAYSKATVGLSLSLTNYSLIPQEMLACGLPVVELAGRALDGVYGDDPPLQLTEADPMALADALERLLDDPELRAGRSAAGLAAVAGFTWERATDQVLDGLRAALRAREIDPAFQRLVEEVEPGHRRNAGPLARAVAVERIGD